MADNMSRNTAVESSRRKERPTKRVKGGTSSTRKHRFESFTQRIAKLNIDPVRRVHRADVEQQEFSTTTSFFKAGLNRWKELNLSEIFTNFVREVEPLCDSLPQILHYNQGIMDLLVVYIEKRDSQSLEPLLILLGSFAHDLGFKFEKHFSRAVTLVASLAAKHSDVQVIEWSFTCLAWLFKYLSRLLVPDLAPLFRIMAPLLGREIQKTYTTRFAAEAMSFLVRKAALVYHKNRKPLTIVVDCILADLDSMAERNEYLELYQYGLMMLFVDSIKGVDRKLHSCGDRIYSCLLERTLEKDSGQSLDLLAVLNGVTIGLIHLTDATTFQPILDIILESIENLRTRSTIGHVMAHERLLLIATAVRKGSRIETWAPIFDALISLLEIHGKSATPNILTVPEAAAVILQSAPLETVTPRYRQVLDILADDHSAHEFIQFCNYFYDLGQERFRNLLLPYFSKFIISNWESNELELCLLLPKIVEESGQNRLTCSEAWQNHIAKTFEDARLREDLIHLCSAYIELMKLISVSSSTTDRVMHALGDMIDQSLGSPFENEVRATFSLGLGLKSYVQHFSTFDAGMPRMRASIFSVASQLGGLAPYLEAVLALVKSTHHDLGNQNLDPLVDVLIENLHSSSHPLRQLSLQIIGALYQKVHLQQADIITTALTIESSPLDLQSARSLSMHVRKLASQYKAASSDFWLQRAIPHFCFGLLTFKFSQLWSDAIDALKEICETRIGEDVVSQQAFRWLEQPESAVSTDENSCTKELRRKPLNPFQCSNLMHIDSVTESDLKAMKMASELITTNFESAHRFAPQSVAGAPSLALKVLLGVPHVAEKRSRQLVPMFLQWAIDKMEEDFSDDPEDMENIALSKDPSHPKLARKDQKAMLELVGCFNNPRVLYRSSEIFEALRNLLANGDIEVQKSALKAIFTWKLQGIQPYQENLINLLDDARFREEISSFVHIDDRISTIEDDHRHELMPVLLRILYGKMIARTGTASGKRGQTTKRRAVLEALSRFGEGDLREFVNIALGPLDSLKIVDKSCLLEKVLNHDLLSTRKQVGLINMIKDMLETLGSQLSPFTPNLADSLMYCMIRAVRGLATSSEASAQDVGDSVQISLLKALRQTGFQCLTLIFSHCSAEELKPYLPIIVTELVSPRLERLAIDTAQSVSGMLRLFSTWASSQDTAMFLADYDPTVVNSVVKCLDVPSAKDEVKLFVLEDILKRVINLVQPTNVLTKTFNEVDNGMIKRKLLHPNMDCILESVGRLLRGSPSKEILRSAIQLVSMLAPLVEGSNQVENLIEVSAFLLDQPSHRVSPISKGDLLRILQHFVPLYNLAPGDALQERIFCTVSSLFGYFKDRANREILSRVLSVLAEGDEELRDVASLCVSLNSFSSQKVDEPDFDERLRAFNIINEDQFQNFSPKQWRPLVYNMIYYVRDNEELAIRSNASFALRRFVETNRFDPSKTQNSDSDLVQRILLPALRNGASEYSELVRTEYLGVMAHLVRHNPDWDEISDMSVLLVKDDEEASFFGNILHIQQHRRLRALRRLGAEARSGHLRSANVAHFLMPLIEHFVFDKADDEGAHNLSAETVLTIGALSSTLEWPQFRALFRRYSGYIQSKPDIEKTVIKLLGVIIDALTHAPEIREIESQKETQEVATITEVEKPSMRSTLSVTMPRQEKLSEDLSNNLLPSLVKYLHEKDESTVSLRVPVAVSVVKLLKLLPADQLRDRLPPVLTDVCHILRSRAQESRDLTRKTLVDISTLIGPGCFGFVLKELRSSLARGYQLHVLSFTVHSMLVATAPIFKPGDLDYCLPQIVAIIMDDIFGATGQEKDAEEYISKMKEVKSSKSYDSMELVAKTATVSHFAHLIRPLQALLQEKLDLKTVKKIDELLRRIGVGFLRNEAINDRQVLVFCHEIIREVYEAGGASEERSSREDQCMKKFLINAKRTNKYGQRGTTTSYNYKLSRFSLDVLRSVLHKFDALQTPANISGFLPIIGDAIVRSNEEVQMSALRLLTAIIKVPLKAIDDNAPIYVAECVKIFKSTISTNTEIAQAALKLVSAILRERRNVEVRENDSAYLLKRLIPDLEEPDRQGVAFNFLKAVMARKIVIPEVYEVLDTVATIMVTNQTRGARDLARGIYFQFIMDYPHGKGRFSKQLGFLVKNLDYKHQEGRQSVMEAIHLLFLKVGEDLVQDIIGTFFVPLVMVVVNDESSQCREMAGALLKTIFERADVGKTQSMLGLLRSWLGQADQPLLSRVALQSYCLFLDTNGSKGEKEIPLLQHNIGQILMANLADTDSADWELLYFALQAFAKICQLFPSSAFATDTAPIWASIRQSLSFPHAWVKLVAARLLGTYFADFARTNADTHEIQLPIRGSGGLWLTEPEMTSIALISLNSLKVLNASSELATQSVRNLVFLGKTLGAANASWPSRTQQQSSDPAAEDEWDGISGSDSDPKPSPFDNVDESLSSEENDATDAPTSTPKTALAFIIHRTSTILRRGPLTTTAPALTALTSSLALFSTLCTTLPTPTLPPHLPTILLPLHNLTDPTIPTPHSPDSHFTDGYKALQTNAQELISTLQKRLGTTVFANAMQKVRGEVKERREGRRGKRAIERVADVERAGREKVRRYERKKGRRRERGGEERGRRRGW